MIRYAFTLCALAASSIVASKAATTAVPGLNVEELCRFVAENLYETDPSRGTDRVYRTRLYQAAGVAPHTDTRDAINAKMQSWWSQNQHRLTCNVPNSIVRNGSILKLAVDRSNSDFIDDAVRRWKVNLNRIDVDGTTVLDFLAEQREKSRDSPRFATLNRYYNIFAAGGAKHAKDLL